MIFNGAIGRPNNGMAGPDTQFTSLPKTPVTPAGPQVQPNVGGTGGTAINPVVSGSGKGVPLGPQVQPNTGGTGGTAINPVDRGAPGPGRQRLASAIMGRMSGQAPAAFSPTAPNPMSTMPTLRQPPYPRG